MDILIAICGFVGGWLLVAGPVWQAALELREEEIDQEAIHAVKNNVTPPKRVSPWWWFLPPVAYFLQARRQLNYRRAFNAALSPEQRGQMVTFLNKANGWIVVAVGGFLIAAKETWDLVSDFHFSVWVFWILIVVMPLFAIANTVRNVANTQKMLNPEQPMGRKPKSEAR